MSRWIALATVVGIELAVGPVSAGKKVAPAPIPPPAPPITDPLSSAVERLALTSMSGVHRVGDFYRGAGDKNTHLDFFVPLQTGLCYLVAGQAGPGIGQLFLYMWDPTNKRVADNKPKMPMVTMPYCPTMPGMFHIQAKVGAGMGEYRVGVYQAGYAPPPPVAVRPTPPPVQVAVQAPPPQVKVMVKAPVVAVAPAYRPPPPIYQQPAYQPPPAYEPPAYDPSAYDPPPEYPPATPPSGFSFSGSSTTTHSSSSSSSTTRTSPGSGARGPDGCDGDWSLGEMAMVNSRNAPGVECNNANAPTNCPTGMFIKLHSQNKCVCVAHCSDYMGRPTEGAACTQDGAWVCDHFQSLSSRNHSTFCAPAAWNLCKR